MCLQEWTQNKQNKMGVLVRETETLLKGAKKSFTLLSSLFRLSRTHLIFLLALCPSHTRRRRRRRRRGHVTRLFICLPVGFFFHYCEHDHQMNERPRENRKKSEWKYDILCKDTLYFFIFLFFVCSSIIPSWPSPWTHLKQLTDPCFFGGEQLKTRSGKVQNNNKQWLHDWPALHDRNARGSVEPLLCSFAT